jgi:glycosyltransferase involved in cell wall biosynthesis
MKTPLVSVVMVVCNVDRFLAESIESILGQTFKDFEFIIVDFGSTDQTKAIVAGYAAKDERIRLHEIPNCGLGAARNAACAVAQGRYIAVMDADDVSLPNRLQLQTDFLEKHPEICLVGGATEWIDATGKSLGIHRFPTEDHNITSRLVSQFPFCHPTVLFRAQAFVEVGGYRLPFVFAEDYDLWLRLIEHFSCANLSEVVLKYRIHLYQVQTRKSRQQTLCLLAAQASASLRRSGKSDLFNSIQEITPEVLAGLGVTRAKQTVTADRDWIRALYEAGDFAIALQAATQALQSAEWKSAERWEIASMRRTVARLYWKERRFARCSLTAVHALIARPTMLGRPVKQLLRWFRLRRETSRRARSQRVYPGSEFPEIGSSGGFPKRGAGEVGGAKLPAFDSSEKQMRCQKTN